ncbi:Uncharacterised protein [Mycobacteroides abscessus subsp. abscessus]|nr:Uncharacterised protein [Mycobacteroides abscessus subsp. abscessus]
MGTAPSSCTAPRIGRAIPTMTMAAVSAAMTAA